MFTKIAIIAAACVLSVSANYREEEGSATATYADESFLDSMSAFGEAEKRMQEW
jgi:hypothetical protein